ncbi:MAG: outer membrane protein assembly factor BamB family protein [Planctomycetota bacterium]|jgi:outer membrane protein assembly factor BamB
MGRRGIVLIGVCLVAPWTLDNVYAHTEDDFWQTWRGPKAMGVAEKGNPPVTWGETKNVKWKVELAGGGTSSPVVWGDRIFFQTAIETNREGAASVSPDPNGDAKQPFHGGRPPNNVYRFNILCLDRNTGEILWQRTAREELPHEGHHPIHGFASYSPVTDGKHVWASFGSRGVHCYEVRGQHKWSRDLGRMRTKLMFGEGSSPALAGDTLIVVMDHEGDSFIYALDKETGKTIWKKPRDERTTWATPIVVEVSGKMQVITNATKRVRSYDLETGSLIWECGGQTGNVIPSPVSGFGKVFCASGFRGNALQAIGLGHTGDLTGSNAISWQVNEATPYVPSPLLYGDKIYVCSGNKAVISCYQAETGKPYFVKRKLEGLGGIFASPVGAAGRVYLVGRKGVTKVIKLSDDFEVLATNTLDDEFDSSPAIVGDELFLKGKQRLYCIAE